MARVRRVGAGDEALWRTAVASLLAPEDREHRVATPAELAEAIADPRCLLFLALDGDLPVGLASAYAFPDVGAGGRIAYLYDIEVGDSHRRAGVGGALIEALLAQSRREGIRLVWAGTEADNTAARRTFERTGAEIEGDRYVEYEWDLDDEGGDS